MALVLGSQTFQGHDHGQAHHHGAEDLGFAWRPLPGRTNIVITRDPAFAVDGVIAVRSVDEALVVAGSHASADKVNEICVIGGGEIFRQTLNRADRLYVTWVLAEIDGDVHFPPIDPKTWEEISSEDFPAGEKDNYATRFVVYERR